MWSAWSSVQVYKQPQKNKDMEILQGNNKNIFISFIYFFLDGQL